METIMQITYIKTKFTNTVNISKIITVHYYEFDKTFVFNGESHDFWEMVYVDKGEVEVKSGNKSLILGQGEIIFHRPNEFHSIKAHNSSPNFFVISFVCKSPAMKHFYGYHATLNNKLKPIIASIISEAENTYIIPKNDVFLSKLTLKASAPIGGEQLVKVYLEQFFILLLRELSKKSKTEIFPSKSAFENQLVETVKKYINDNITSKITVNEVCKKIGYGKSVLCSVFQYYTGTGICHYANSRKIEYSKTLIREGNMNFTEISDYLSFDNPQYFSRVFKRITGITPSEFKFTLIIPIN